MNFADELLKSLGVKDVKDYDDLTPEEQDTYRKMLDVQSQSQVSLDDVKKHIHSMRMAVEYELATHEVNDRRDLLLKARLKNYLLLEALFDRPERAKEMLKQYATRVRL